MTIVQNGLVVIEPPDSEPITVEEAKSHLVVEHDLDDSLIEGYISAARESAEKYLKQSLVTRTLELTLGRFPFGLSPIPIPYSPLGSVTSIHYQNDSGASTLLPETEYQIVKTSIPGFICLPYGKTWPVYRRVVESIKIRYYAGYGVAADVPKAIRQAIFLIIGQHYLQREQVTFGRLAKAPFVAVDLMRPFRRITV